jgi:hypothetical protein
MPSSSINTGNDWFLKDFTKNTRNFHRTANYATTAMHYCLNMLMTDSQHDFKKKKKTASFYNLAATTGSPPSKKTESPFLNLGVATTGSPPSNR